MRHRRPPSAGLSPADGFTCLTINLFLRAKAVGLVKGDRLNVPITQLHLADTLGLSVGIRIGRSSGCPTASWCAGANRGCEVLNEEGLLNLAQWKEDSPHQPYL